jgi:PAS domain S-box-containing protein
MMAFVDVRMPPGWDGVETTGKIWEHYPDLQVVICTAYSDYSLEEMIDKLGHSDRLVILKKPFDNIEVQQLANALTEKWQLLQQAKSKMDDLEKAVADRTRELKAANEKLRGEIDERQRAAEVLRATQEKLNHLLAASPVIIYSHKVEGQTLIPAWVSENITEVLGYGVEEWYQPDWITAHLYPDDQPKVAAATQELFEQGHCSNEYRLRLGDGTYRWIRDERNLLRDETGATIQVVGACTDITERRQLEDQLRQSQKMEAIGQLAGGVAHDFNNLLTVICCHTQLMLVEKSLTPKMADALGQIARAAERAAALTGQLLAYGRKQVVHLRDLNLDELISRVLTMLHRVLGEDIALQTEFAEPNLTIDADEFLSPELRSSLRELVAAADVDRYELLWKVWDGRRYVTERAPFKPVLSRRRVLRMVGILHSKGEVDGAVKRVLLNLEHRPRSAGFSWRLVQTVWRPRVRLQAREYLSDLNTAPRFNNHAHGSTGNLTTAKQIEAFLKPDGSVQNFCAGPCDPE